MTLVTRLSLLALTIAACSISQAQDLVPLKLSLPKPMLVGTPVPANIPNLERPGTTKRPELLVPKGTVNLALHKEVTSSDSEPVIGDLSLITDGEKGGDEGNYVELGQGKQWVQIDLGQSAPLYAVAVWHYHSQARVYFNVVVQLCDDPAFLKDVTTIYNSDTTNALGLGAGKDFLYVETYQGRLIDAKGVKARYVRLYSRGNSSNEMNHYIEVEVYGKPNS